jgi:hypothetical protein
MEKKDLRERLVDIMHYDGTYSTSDLVKFIQQELGRVREETRQEERDMFIVRYATVSFNEVIKTIKTLSIIEFLSIKWGLKGKKKSKLTTK